MTNAERIKALRNCSDGFCSLCPYDDYELSTKECEAKLMLDAADALEADEQQIADLQKQVNEFIKNETHSTVIKVMSKRIAELEAQLPKEGEWIQMNGHRYCNICGHKDSPILANYLQNWKRSCPYCGAKMRGEHDEVDC